MVWMSARTISLKSITW